MLLTAQMEWRLLESLLANPMPIDANAEANTEHLNRPVDLLARTNSLRGLRLAISSRIPVRGRVEEQAAEYLAEVPRDREVSR